MQLVKFPMRRSGKIWKERVYAGGKGEPRDVLAGDRRAVQRDAALMAQITQDAAHQGGLARAVLPEQAHDLTGAKRKRDLLQRFLVAIGLTDRVQL